MNTRLPVIGGVPTSCVDSAEDLPATRLPLLPETRRQFLKSHDERLIGRRDLLPLVIEHVFKFGVLHLDLTG